MDTVIAGTPTIELMKLCYAAKQPVLLCGRHGIGKSELLERAAAELKIKYISRDLSLMESVDLTGLPKAIGEVTKYVPPAFLPTSGSGLLVFEELNRCDRYVRTPCLQLLTARCLNDYQLPEGWLPVAAINPADEDYEVFELDGAMLSRFVQVRVVPDQAEWLEWAADNGIHQAVLDYIRKDPTVFESPESNPAPGNVSPTSCWRWIATPIRKHSARPSWVWSGTNAASLFCERSSRPACRLLPKTCSMRTDSAVPRSGHGSRTAALICWKRRCWPSRSTSNPSRITNKCLATPNAGAILARS